MSLCIRYYAIIVSTEAILSDIVVLFFPIFPTCACVSFQLYFVHACAIEKIAINNINVDMYRKSIEFHGGKIVTEQCKVELVISIMLRFLHFYFFTRLSILNVTLSLEC